MGVFAVMYRTEGSSPVAITERRDMGLYEVPVYMSLLVLGLGMLANFHMCSMYVCVKSSFQHDGT